MSKRKLSASEAIYGFCAWLTTRDEKTFMSAKHNSAPIPERIREFCETNNLEFPRGGWEKGFEFPTK